MPDLTFRALTPDDQDTLWEMLYHAIHVPEGSPPPSPDIVQLPGLSRYVVNWGREGDFGTAAVDQAAGQIVGAVWLRLWSADEKGYGYVDLQTPELSIALLPDYRGLGIGSQLMSAALEAAQSRYPAVSLSVSPDNPAKRLYERFGFETVGSDGDSLIMLKKFNAE